MDSTVRILLRHADAGSDADSAEPDAWRGLTPLGRLQAAGLVGRLRDLPVVRVFSSPELRCRQTVVPIARWLSVDVEPRAELAVGADPGRLLAFIGAAETQGAVLCAQPETLDRLTCLPSDRPTAVIRYLSVQNLSAQAPLG